METSLYFDRSEQDQYTEYQEIYHSSPSEASCNVLDDKEFDAFDQHLLAIAEQESRIARASQGQIRLSLPDVTRSLQQPSAFPTQHTHTRASRTTPRPSSRGVSQNSAPGHQTASRKSDQQYQSASVLSDIEHDSVVPSQSVVSGVPLVTTRRLQDDRLVSIFPFRTFNAVQSRCFSSLFNTDHNFVLSAPTGSGKTVIFELAIGRIIRFQVAATYKIIYMAPTKALCAERTKDWTAKFRTVNIIVKEITGDSDTNTLKSVKDADIVVTTPEKWDSMTRKWRDHQRLVELVRLMLIDEVHILGKDRGATLEAVVSRMKSIGSNIRFIALSATIPNASDIALWLGRDNQHPRTPAALEMFGPEFRPVPLRLEVVGYDNRGNDFQFDTLLTKKLPEVLSRVACGKPIMIFCFTKASCEKAAEVVADSLRANNISRPAWPVSTRNLVFENANITLYAKSGVAFHHAGLSLGDRTKVEELYLKGINLPCHTVIIKGTVGFDEGSPVELSDLEISQMLGRAGRPQFDRNASAIIMTRAHRKEFFNQIVTCQHVLESRLHLNLIEHINAEIGLGSITDHSSALRWLGSTFLAVRLRQNPGLYKISDTRPTESTEEYMSRICAEAITSLLDHDLIDREGQLHQSAFGAAMARYSISFETMKGFVVRSPRPKVSEILCMMSQASEFRDLKLRPKERQAFKLANTASSIRFPFKTDLAQSSQKVSLIIQSVLGGDDALAQHEQYRHQFVIDRGVVFQHSRRLIRCMVDCQIAWKDSIGISNCLMLVRSFGAQVWDDSRLTIQQLRGIGPSAARRLISAGIDSIETIAACDASRLESCLGRNPPLGMNIIKAAHAFPQLRISMKLSGSPMIKRDEHVKVTIEAEIAFIHRRPLPDSIKNDYVCFLAETSDGMCIEFCKISPTSVATVFVKTFQAELSDPDQIIRCSVSCEERAGTLCEATLRPKLPASAFDGLRRPRERLQEVETMAVHEDDQHSFGQLPIRARSEQSADLLDESIPDAVLVGLNANCEGNTRKRKQGQSGESARVEQMKSPRRLQNGNYECQHGCKDRAKCKHDCCKNGVESKPRKKPKRNAKDSERKATADIEPGPQQRVDPQSSIGESRMASEQVEVCCEQVDLSQRPTGLGGHDASDQDLTANNLAIMPLKNASSPERKDSAVNSRRSRRVSLQSDEFDDTDEICEAFDSLDPIATTVGHDADQGPMPFRGTKLSRLTTPCVRGRAASLFDEDTLSDQEMLDAALVGTEDSIALRTACTAEGAETIGWAAPATLGQLLSQRPCPPSQDIDNIRSIDQHGAALVTKVRSPFSREATAASQNDYGLIDSTVHCGATCGADSEIPVARVNRPHDFHEMAAFVRSIFGDCVELVDD